MAKVTLDESALPQGLGAARPVQLPATRYSQGGREMYHVVVTLAGLTTQIVVKRPDPTRPIEGNRRVDPNRAKKFALYIQQNEDWVSPAVIVRAPSGEIKFEPVKEFEDGTAWGVLSIPLHVLTEILLLDGQHRTLGTFLALDQINERITKTTDLLRAAEKLDDKDVADHHRRELGKFRKTRDRLSSEHMAVDIAVVTTDQAKQMFADINNNAKGVNPDYTTVLDQRDVINRIAAEVMEEHPLLHGRVEVGQERRMSSANPNLLGAKAVADIVRAVHVGPTGRVGRRVEAELTADQVGATVRVKRFLDLLVAGFSDLNAVMHDEVDAIQLRHESMLGSATMLRALAGAYRELTAEPQSPEDPPRLSRSEIELFFKHLEPRMREIPIREEDPLWMPTGAFTPGSNAPQATAGGLRQLVDALVSWARDSEKGPLHEPAVSTP